MNFFICKCDNNQNQDEKTYIDLLNIKNLEKSLKKKEKKLLKTDNSLELNHNFSEKEIIEEEQLQIIEYPYLNKENNNNKKKNNNINNENFVNLPKINMINKNNLFDNKDINSQKNRKNDKDDANSSSLNNESLIIDDFEYLNDEDIIQVQEKKIKNNKNSKIKYNKPNIQDINIKYINREKNKKMSNNFKNINKLYQSPYNKRNDNESLKSNNTTKVSTINNSNKKIYSLCKINNDKGIPNLNISHSIQKIYKKNKNELPSLNCRTENNSEVLINKKLFKKKSVEKKNKSINNDFSDNSIINKDKNSMNNKIINKRRIFKRKVNIKKIKINLNTPKKNIDNK